MGSVVHVDISDPKASLSVLADRAAAGEEIILAKHGTAVARITALPLKEPRRPGVARHWTVNNDALLAPTDPVDLDAADGLHTDDLGVTRRPPA